MTITFRLKLAWAHIEARGWFARKYRGVITSEGARRMGIPTGTAVTFTLRPQWHPYRYRVAGWLFVDGKPAGGCLSFYDRPGDPDNRAGIAPLERLPWEAGR